MGTLTGGRAYDAYYDIYRDWKPIGPAVDEWQFYVAKSTDGYVCLGVVGNRAHWAIKNAGDHTSRSSHSTVINGKTVYPKSGWVYAVDGRVPEPKKFEGWLVSQLRAGRYPHLKYFNINNHHYNQKTGWGSWVANDDEHLHMSFDPGAEYADSSILADYERYRTGRPTTPKPPSTPKPSPTGLPVLRRGTSASKAVRKLQGLLVAHGSGLKVDGAFGPRTYAAVRSFQARKKISVDGVVGAQTWGKLDDGQATVNRGDEGFAVRWVQGLLVAQGHGITVDGDFGPRTDAAVRSFQAGQKITKDGIAGPVTRGRLLSR